MLLSSSKQLLLVVGILLTLVSTGNARDICDHVSRIETIPFQGNAGVDANYDALIAAGKSAVPCLIRTIANTTPKRDPRQIPHWAGVTTTVGDTALWVLQAITGVDTIKMLPLKYQRLYEQIGAHAESVYLQRRRNRLALQRKLRNWYRTSNVTSLRNGAT